MLLTDRLVLGALLQRRLQRYTRREHGLAFDRALVVLLGGIDRVRDLIGHDVAGDEAGRSDPRRQRTVDEATERPVDGRTQCEDPGRDQQAHGGTRVDERFDNVLALVVSVEQVGEGLLLFGEVGARDLPLACHAQVFDLTADQPCRNDGDTRGQCLDERELGDLAVVDLRPGLPRDVSEEKQSGANHEPGLLALLAANERTQRCDRAFQATLGAFDQSAVSAAEVLSSLGLLLQPRVRDEGWTGLQDTFGHPQWFLLAPEGIELVLEVEGWPRDAVDAVRFINLLEAEVAVLLDTVGCRVVARTLNRDHLGHRPAV